MSICVAVTNNKEGQTALEAGVQEALALGQALVLVNLTESELDIPMLAPGLATEVATPEVPEKDDDVEQVLRVIEDRPDITRLVVGVRRRSPIGKAVLGSIAQRLILEAAVPVLAVKVAEA